MSEIHGEKFNNGDTCEILSFVSPDGAIEMDVIDIDQEYPAGAFTERWSINERSNMMAILASGSGRIAVRETVEGVTSVRITEFGPHNAAYVPAGTPYSWQSDPKERLMVTATFIPPFDDQFYSVVTTDELKDTKDDNLIHQTLDSYVKPGRD